MSESSAVFRAIADFSSLRREAKRTRDDLQRLDTQASRTGETVSAGMERGEKSTHGLARAIEQAAARVKQSNKGIQSNFATTAKTVRSDVDRMKDRVEEFSRALDRVPRDVDVQVSADVSQAESRIARLRKQLATMDEADVVVDADVAKAMAQLRLLDKEVRKIDRNVDVDIGVPGVGSGGGDGVKALKRDTDASTSSTKDLRAALVQLAGGFGIVAAGIQLLKIPTLITGLQAAIGVVGALTAAVFALGGALGPVVGLIPALAAGVGSLAQAGGVVAGSFFGVGDALKAYIADEKAATKASTAGSSSAVAAAKQRLSAARAIEDASRGLADAEESAAEAVEAAQHALTEAHEDAARAVAQAVRRVIEAEQDVTDAHREAARAVEAANRRIVTAERALAEAQEDTETAQRDLNDARRDALRDLQALRREVERGALSESRAVLALEEARVRLTEAQMEQTSAGVDYAEIQRRQRGALLDVQEAENDLADIRRTRTEQANELTQAELAGVDGAEQVVRAQEGVEDASQGVVDAQQALADAHQALADSQEESARRIAAAESALVEAHRGVAEAQEDGAERIATAQERVTKAQEDGAEAVASAQRQLARAIEDSTQSSEEAAGTTDTFTAAMAGQTPVAHALVAALLGFRDPLRDLRAAGQEAMFPGLISALGVLLPLLGALRPAVSATGAVIGGLAEQVAGFVASPMFQSTFLSILDGNVSLISALGTAIIPLIDAVARLTLAAQPLALWLANLIAKWAQAADEAVKTGEATGSLAAFFDRTRIVVELLFSVLGNLLGILGNIGAAGAAVGLDLLEAFDKALGKVREFTGSPEGKSRLEEFFERIQPLLEEVGGLVGDVIGMFARLTETIGPQLTPIIEAIRSDLLPALEGLFGAFDPAFGEAIVGLLASVVRFAAVFLTNTDALTLFVEGLGTLLDKAVEIQQAMGPAGDVLVEVLTVLSGAGFIAGVLALAAGLGRLVFSLLQVGPILAFVVSPAGLVVLALAALAAGFILAYQNSEEFRAVVQRVVDWFTAEALPQLQAFADSLLGTFQDIVQWFRDNSDDISEAFGHVINVLSDLWDHFGSRIIEIVQTTFGFIKEFIQATMQIIQGVIELVMALINGEWGKAWEAVKMILGGVWDAMFAIVRLVIDQIWNYIQLILAGIRFVWDVVWAAIADVLHNIWEAMKAIVTAAFNFISDVIHNILNVISVIWQTTWDVISTVLSTIWETMKSIVSGGIDWVRGRIEDVLNGIKTIWDQVWGGLRDGLGGIWEGIKTAVKAGINGLIDLVNGTLIKGANVLLRFLPGDVQIPDIPKFHTGGEVQGRGQGDRVTIAAEPGEFVMRRKAVQRIGVDNLEHANAGGSLRGYQRGGQVGTGGPFDWITDNPVVDTVGDIVSGAVDIGKEILAKGARAVYAPVKGLVTAALDHLPGADTLFGSAAKGVGLKVLETIERLIGDKDDERPRFTTGGTGTGYGWQAITHYLDMKGQPYIVNSTVRPGTRHGMGLAVDLGGDLDAIANVLLGVKQSLFELIYNPGASVKEGRDVDPSFWGANTWAQHGGSNAHVHAATFTGPSEGPGLPTGGPGDVAGGGDFGGRLVGASEFGGPGDPGTGTHGYRGDYLPGTMSYAELSTNPGSGNLDFAALGGLQYLHPLTIGYNGRSVIARKRDVGAGGGSVNGLPRAIDLWWETARELGFSGTDTVSVAHGGGLMGKDGLISAKKGEVMLRAPVVDGMGVDTALGINAYGLMGAAERQLVGSMAMSPAASTASPSFDTDSDWEAVVEVHPNDVTLDLDGKTVASATVHYMPAKIERRRKGRPQ